MDDGDLQPAGAAVGALLPGLWWLLGQNGVGQHSWLGAPIFCHLGRRLKDIMGSLFCWGSRCLQVGSPHAAYPRGSGKALVLESFRSGGGLVAAQSKGEKRIDVASRAPPPSHLHSGQGPPSHGPWGWCMAPAP